MFSNLAMIQQAQGDLPAARANMEKAIAIERKHFAPDHPNLGANNHNLAAIFGVENEFMIDVDDAPARCAWQWKPGHDADQPFRGYQVSSICRFCRGAK